MKIYIKSDENNEDLKISDNDKTMILNVFKYYHIPIIVSYDHYYRKTDTIMCFYVEVNNTNIQLDQVTAHNFYKDLSGLMTSNKMNYPVDYDIDEDGENVVFEFYYC